MATSRNSSCDNNRGNTPGGKNEHPSSAEPETNRAWRAAMFRLYKECLIDKHGETEIWLKEIIRRLGANGRKQKQSEEDIKQDISRYKKQQPTANWSRERTQKWCLKHAIADINDEITRDPITAKSLGEQITKSLVVDVWSGDSMVQKIKKVEQVHKQALAYFKQFDYTNSLKVWEEWLKKEKIRRARRDRGS